jgi:hypothetical protein
VSTPEFRPVTLRVSCLNIRHKLMYCDERHATPGLVDDTSDTRVFWCVKTQASRGPDGGPVRPAECTAARACYCHGVPTSPETEPRATGAA